MSTDSDKHVDGQSKLERALAAVQEGDLDSARQQFEDLVMDDPHDPLTLYNLGLCYNEAGSYEAARKTLLSCLALDPGEANTYVALGLAEAKLGQMPELRERRKDRPLVDGGPGAMHGTLALRPLRS